MIIDLDNFKALNDHYGHHFGDLCLQAVAKACQSCIRAGDLAARFGGDEFILLLPDTDQAAADAIKMRLQSSLQEQAVEEGELGPVNLSISVGIGLWKSDDKSFNDILKRADKNMYHEKKMKNSTR